jgi:hypothetical protein
MWPSSPVPARLPLSFPPPLTVTSLFPLLPPSPLWFSLPDSGPLSSLLPRLPFRVFLPADLDRTALPPISSLPHFLWPVKIFGPKGRWPSLPSLFWMAAQDRPLRRASWGLRGSPPGRVLRLLPCAVGCGHGLSSIAGLSVCACIGRKL